MKSQLARLRSSASSLLSRATQAFKSDGPLTQGIARQRSRSRHSGPKISIVIPIYNVEKYISECLESVLKQTVTDIEVIVVDDASPDSSSAIVSEYIDRDNRVRMLTFPENRGLSAARNAGAAVARGEYLLFVDSDDMLEPNACEVLSEKLDRSGSDFAVMGYKRFNSKRIWGPAWWIQELHAKPRSRVTAAEFPEIMINATAWSKLFRRSFWETNQFQFREGMKYEDQEVSSRCYALAQGIDLIDEMLYLWRVRDDGSSITQQKGDPEAFADFMAAVNYALNVLDENRAPELVAARLSQILQFDMTYRTSTAVYSSSKYWEVLVRELRSLLHHERFHNRFWEDIPPVYRIAYELVLRDDWPNFITLLRDSEVRLSSLPTVIKEGAVYSRLPFYGDAGLAIPEERYKLRPRDVQLKTRTAQVRWSEKGTLIIRGSAYIQRVDCSQYPVNITATLVETDTGARIPCQVSRFTDPTISDHSTDRLANHDPSGIEMEIPAQLLEDHPGTSWLIQVSVDVEGFQASAALNAQRVVASAHQSMTKTRIQLRTGSDKELRLVVDSPAVIASAVRYEENDLVVHLRTTSSRKLTRLMITTVENQDIPVADVRRVGIHDFKAVIKQGAVRAQGLSGHIKVEGGRGKIHPVVVGAGMAMPLLQPGADLRPFQMPGGNLKIDYAEAIVTVMKFDLDETDLLLELDVDSGDRTSLDVEITLHRDDGVGTAARITLEPGVQIVRMPMLTSLWGGPLLPLPLGRYEIRLTCAGVATRCDWLTAAKGNHRRLLESDRIAVKIDFWRSGTPIFRVVPPLSSSERGMRHQARFRTKHRTSTSPVRRGTVLFRSYYGETASGNALAVHQEIMRRNLGYTLYWTVTDYSVPVPKGGIPVLYESKQWYELLSTVEYYMDNTHQSYHHYKPAGQKIIATFHGYPFKLMGLEWWEKAGFSPKHVKSYLRRAKEWDYLVSPATYATPLLTKSFGYTGKVLEIGYPRNDRQCSRDREEYRQKVRQLLGIQDDQTAILYAPTFRDYLSHDDMSATRVDFVNFDEIAKRLGEKYKILIRGHAFNARAGERFSTEHVVDVTSYPIAEELYLAADAAIVDYSSLRFDFALTGKPMIFLVPDKERYIEGRGWIIDFDKTSPGPHVTNEEETLDAIKNLTKIHEEYSAEYQSFLDSYVDLDDGRASARLVDRVFLPE